MGNQGQSSATNEYYPSRLSQPGVSSSSRRAFLISGKDDNKTGNSGAQPQILGVFFKHKVKITSQLGYVDEKRGDFVLTLCCDMRSADTDSNGIVLELRQIKFVDHATSVLMKNHIFDGFLFPLTLMDSRVIALDSRLMFWIEDRLKSSEQKAILTDVGRLFAIDITKQIRGKFPVGTTDSIIQENVTDYLKASGLGRFNFFDSEGNSIRAVIRDPPVSERGEATGNHFLHGIMIGLIEAFQNRTLTVVEDLYDPRTARLFLVLVHKENLAKLVESAIPEDPTMEEARVRALEEVENVIKSIDAKDRSEKEDPTTTLIVPTAGGKIGGNEAVAIANSTIPASISVPSLNQILKVVHKEGWSDARDAFHPRDDREKEAPQSDKIISKFPAEPEIGLKKSLPHAPVASSVVREKKKKKPTPDELERAFRRELSGWEDVFFEESYLD